MDYPYLKVRFSIMGYHGLVQAFYAFFQELEQPDMYACFTKYVRHKLAGDRRRMYEITRRCA